MFALRLLRLLFPAALLFSVNTPTGAAENLPGSAWALADAMQVVESTRLAMEARTRAGIEKGHNSQKELECWKATDFTPTRAVYATAFARLMPSAEMEEAAAFLTTPLGKKIIQFMNAEGLRARGLTADGPSLTEEEAEVALKFLSTGAGSKLYSEDLQSAELQKGLLDTLLPAFQKCMEPKSTARYFAELDASMTPEERERAASSAADTTRPSPTDAVRLVRAMREDEMFLAQLRQRINEETRSIPAVRRACLDSLQPTDISSAMAVAVQERLSASEVKEATDYYESVPGRKFTSVVLSNVERPVELEDFFKVMTVDEAKSLRAFFMLSASRKLLLEKVIQQPASIDRVTTRFRELIVACSREGGPKR